MYVRIPIMRVHMRAPTETCQKSFVNIYLIQRILIKLTIRKNLLHSQLGSYAYYNDIERCFGCTISAKSISQKGQYQLISAKKFLSGHRVTPVYMLHLSKT